ncbi:hypothetical protein Drose_00615 [Dactylosporangium roseum]|uniref:Uncharacterized protein n=1 Tax=Dactylosporangium roseum TaxID=47989 RepID=A0ABY5Z4D2_9ACTN|nr:hypothetical protein [Dactylosporangium roseum]UWZ36879.1 hypothetical protein Drose_00615 [Dactylosporangium roseum]
MDNPESWQPRITPSPPPQRGKVALWLLVGLAVGILLAGPAGYFTSRSMNGAEPKATESSTPEPGRSLSAYESVRRDLNKQKLSGDLAALADPWLPYLGGCLTNSDPYGPALNQGEKIHVGCMYGGISAHFALYDSSASRDEARAYHHRLNADAANLASGLAPPAKKTGAKTQVSGQYIEYANRLSTGTTICGVWWDRDDGSAAVMLEAVCDREFNGRWEPLRDIWQQYS